MFVRRSSLALFVALTAACAPAPVVPQAAPDGEKEVRRSQRFVPTAGKALREATGAARIGGVATGPAGLVGGNIVSNNSAAVVGQNGAGIVAGNTGRYTVAQAGSYKEEAVANALVYLTDPEERFFAKDGQPISATTDERGGYQVPEGIAVDQVVIVNVILADNRREVGFLRTSAGENKVDVSLASTYVTEFLRARAALVGKKMGDYDLTKLERLTVLTAQALRANELPVPDLSIAKIPDMNHAYALVVGQNPRGLGDAWAEMLGERVLAMTTVAGTGNFGASGDGGPATAAELMKPIGLARDATGNLYIIDEGAHTIRRVGPDGTIARVAGGVERADFDGDGGLATNAALNWPRTAAFGPGGKLYVADTVNQRIRLLDPATGLIGTFAGAPSVVNGMAINDFAGDGGQAAEARFAGARGLAFAPDGTLFVADTWDAGGNSWHHIRRIKPDGIVETIVGVDGMHGFNGDGKPGRETQINFVNQLALDKQGDLFFTDTRNHRIRRWEAATGLVTTVAGTGTDGKAGDGGLATAAELSSPYGLQLDTATTPATIFIAERGSRRIRAVMPDGKIRTLAGGGDKTTDGEARAMALNEPIELLREPDGNLLLADSRGAKVRRLWLKWGF